MTSTKTPNSKTTNNKTTSKSTPEPTPDLAADATVWFDTSDVDYLDLMKQAGDAWIQNLADTQAATLAATKAAIESFANQAETTQPADAVYPSVREIVETNFEFADKYLANQKDYAAKVLELHGA